MPLTGGATPASYQPGGTDVALADGGTGASLTDPGADRILFWDESENAIGFLTASTGLTITTTNITASGSAGAVTREGGNLTEATTTSTTVVDLLTAASLTLAAAETGFWSNSARKSAGAASGVGGGMKLNATVVDTPVTTAGSTNNISYYCTSTDRAESGFFVGWIRPSVTNHTFGAAQSVGMNWSTGGNGASSGAVARTITGDKPTAAITDVVLNAISDSGGLITVGMDELNVYSYANA